MPARTLALALFERGMTEGVTSREFHMRFTGSRPAAHSTQGRHTQAGQIKGTVRNEVFQEQGDRPCMGRGCRCDGECPLSRSHAENMTTSNRKSSCYCSCAASGVVCMYCLSYCCLYRHMYKARWPVVLAMLVTCRSAISNTHQVSATQVSLQVFCLRYAISCCWLEEATGMTFAILTTL